jgi:DNA-directed RNA polymerase specialized sigma24 family protein
MNFEMQAEGLEEPVIEHTPTEQCLPRKERAAQIYEMCKTKKQADVAAHFGTSQPSIARSLKRHRASLEKTSEPAMPRRQVGQL